MPENLGGAFSRGHISGLETAYKDCLKLIDKYLEGEIE